jgi:hypothetical protein
LLRKTLTLQAASHPRLDILIQGRTAKGPPLFTDRDATVISRSCDTKWCRLRVTSIGFVGSERFVGSLSLRATQLRVGPRRMRDLDGLCVRCVHRGGSHVRMKGFFRSARLVVVGPGRSQSELVTRASAGTAGQCALECVLIGSYASTHVLH